VAVQFAENLKRVKQVTKEWDREKKIRDDQTLMNIESKIHNMYEADGGGFLTNDLKELLVSLQKDRGKSSRSMKKNGD
jgi:hypothetical protein